MQILVTGAAGFIGFHVCQYLLERGDQVLGLDNLNSYYDVALKRARLDLLLPRDNFKFFELDIADRQAMSEFFILERPERVVHLAAQAGVRYSLKNPHSYVDSNLVGFVNVLEGCRNTSVEHLVYASSSSVYGENTRIPFSVKDSVDHPVSLYAATKKSNELMAHSYSHLYRIPMTGLRFFTVYGPWGRPDMAYFSFTKSILAGETISVFNEGQMQRDFTYIDDVVEGVVRVLDHTPVGKDDWDASKPDPSCSSAPYKVYNIGNHSPVKLMTFIETLEQYLGRKANKRLLPMQPGDVTSTYADVGDLMKDVGFTPSTPLAIGIEKFIDWYREFYQCEKQSVMHERKPREHSVTEFSQAVSKANESWEIKV